MVAYGIQAGKINGTTYKGMRGYVIDRARTFASEGYDGTIHETHHSIIQSAATAELTTAAAKTLLSAMGTSGTSNLPFVTLDGVAGLVLYGAQVSSPGVAYDSTSDHTSYTALNGYVVAESFKWSLGQALEMGVRAYLLSTNGTADPITISNANALPTQAVNTEAYTCTALTLNGSSVTTIGSVELTIGHKLAFEYLAGNPFPTMLSGAGPRGRAEFRLTAEIANLAQSEGTGAVSVVFTSLTNSGTLGSSTITLTLNGGWTLADRISGSNTSPMQHTLTVRPAYNGTTLPFTWAVT